MVVYSRAVLKVAPSISLYDMEIVILNMIRLKSAIMIGTIYPEFTTVPGKREKRERITCK